MPSCPGHHSDSAPLAAPKPAAPRRAFLEIFLGPAAAWSILLLSIALTGLGWWVSSSYVERRAAERFRYEANRAEYLVHQRMLIFKRMLLGARGMFIANGRVSRQDWSDYVTALRLPEYYAGVQGLGHIRWVKRADQAGFEAQVRAEGFPDFAIKPPGEREESAVVTYLEPFEQRNLRAFGYDLWSEPVRRAGLSRARDTGQPALTDKILLVQETESDVQPGVIMVIPLYRTGQPIDTVAERRAALLGWIHAPFRMRDLMQGILGNANPEIGFDLFDGERPTAAAHLFDSDAEIGHVPATYQPSRTETRRIELAGRPWTLRFHTRPAFEAATSSSQPFLIAFGGMFIDGLLFAIIWALGGQRQRAERLADLRTRELQQANATLQAEMLQRERTGEHAKASLARVSEFNRLAVGREHRMIELKQRINELSRALGRPEAYDLTFAAARRSEAVEHQSKAQP